jgi:hypothetical protein
MTNPDDSFFGGAAGLTWPRASDTPNGRQYTDTALLGVIRGGVIVAEVELQNRTEMGNGRPMTFNDGRPKQQAVITLLCDGSRGGARDERDRGNPSDTGRRKLYVKSYMVAAVREALQAAGVTGIAVGGELYVAWVGSTEGSVKGGDPARLWKARYVPPTTVIPDGYAQSQPQGAQPQENPFGGAPTVTGPPPAAQQPVPAQPADPWAGGTPLPAQQPVPANPFGGQTAPAPAQQQPVNPWG